MLMFRAILLRFDVVSLRFIYIGSFDNECNEKNKNKYDQTCVLLIGIENEMMLCNMYICAPSAIQNDSF